MPYIRDVVCEEAIGRSIKAISPGEAAAFERLLNTKTIAVRNALAAEGRFPIVIYHAGLGGSYEDNSVLFEYLASHGYLVVSSAYSQASATTMNIDWDLKRSFRDMEFLARYACGLPNADANRLAAMGHSYGAPGGARVGGRAVVGASCGSEHRLHGGKCRHRLARIRSA